jgi:cyclohexadienyl dehydratase
MRSLFFAVLAIWACAPAWAQPDHLERIRSLGEVRVCIWPEYYGISFRDPLTQELAGLDVDMAKELGKDLGARVRFVESSFSRLIDDVSADRCDIAMFAIGITPARQQKLRFTRPYLRSDIYGITTRSNRRIRTWEDIDKPGIVVAVTKGTIHEAIMGERLRSAKLRVMDNAQARELEVVSGRADVFMADYPYSRRMLESTDWARLVSPPATFHLTSYAYAMQPGDDAWHARLEAFVADIKRDGRLASSAQRHKLLPIIVGE